MLFAVPAVRHFRRVWPAARLTMLCGPWAQTIAERNPYLDEVLTCQFPWFSRQPRKSLLEPYWLLREEAKRLRDRAFDLAIAMRFDHWWGAWLSYWAGIPYRLGYNMPEVAPFLTQAVPYARGRHEVLQNLALAEAATDTPANADQEHLEFSPTAEEVEMAQRLLDAAGVQSQDWLVCVHPGAGAPVKLWDNRAWAQAIQALMREYGLRVVLTGGPGEMDLVRELETLLAAALDSSGPARFINLAGRTSLGQLAAVMQRCRLVLGVDSGPMHLAVAVGVPTLHLFGPADVRLFGPWGDPQRHLVVTSPLLCAPCNRMDYNLGELNNHPCMREISVESVLAAARRLLDAGLQG